MNAQTDKVSSRKQVISVIADCMGVKPDELTDETIIPSDFQLQNNIYMSLMMEGLIDSISVLDAQRTLRVKDIITLCKK